MIQSFFRPYVVLAVLAVCITPQVVSAQICPYNYYSDTLPFIIDGQITSFAKHGNKLIMGGGFDLISTPNKGVAVVGTDGQTVTSFASPQPGEYFSLYESDGLGGAYATRTNSEQPLVHFLPDGTLSTWRPVFSTIDYYPPVITAILNTGEQIIVTGFFDSVDGIARKNFAVFDIATGDLKPTQVNGIQFGITQMVLIGSKLYLSGEFDSIGGYRRGGLASIDTLSWSVTNWNPIPADDNAFQYFPRSIVGSNNTLAVLGEFDTIMNQPRFRLAAFDGHTGALKPFNPDVNGGVQAIALKGDILYMAGRFYDIDWIPRRNFGAIDINTGVLTSWNPAYLVNAHEYKFTAMTIQENTLYVGGRFNQMIDQSRIRLAAIDLLSGELTDWNPKATNPPARIVVSQDHIFLSGHRNEPVKGTGGIIRKNLAAIDTLSGLLTNWNPNENQITAGSLTYYNEVAKVSAMAVLGDTLYVGGTFDYIGGYKRNNLAAIDITTGAVLNWGGYIGLFNSQFWDYCGVNTIVTHNDAVYIGGDFTYAAGQSRNRLAAFSVSTGNLLPFNPNINGTDVNSNDYAVTTLFCDSNMLYVGGRFTAISSLSRQYLASIDLNTGNLSSWNPKPNYSVTGINKFKSSILVVGGFDSITANTALRKGFAAFDRLNGNLLPTCLDSIVSTSRANCIYVNDNNIYLGGVYSHKLKEVSWLEKGTGLLQLDSTFHVTNWYPNQAIFKYSDPGYSRNAIISCNKFLYSSSRANEWDWNNTYFLNRQAIVIPKIAVQPVSLSVCTGGTGYASFIIDGPTSTFTWRQNNIIKSVSSDYGDMSIWNASLADTGWYQCTAVSSCATFQSDSFYVTVNGEKPVVNFTVNDSIQCFNNNQFVFTNQSTVSSGTLRYNWILGNGKTTEQADTSLSYSTPGTYYVRLVAYQNGSSCFDYKDKLMVVEPVPDATITTNDPTLFCGNGTVLMTANNDTELSYQWLRDGLPIDDAIESTYTANSGGVYSIVESASNGCLDTSTNIEVVMNPLPIVSFNLTLDSISESAPAVVLTGGLPIGGTYSGEGVSNGNFDPAAAGAGIHSITYTYVDSNSCKDSISKTINVFVETGLFDVSGSNELKLYPNPANNELFVKLSSPLFDGKLRITDIYGKIQIEQLCVTNLMQVDISGLSTGSYFLSLSNNEYTLKMKFIKMKN